MFGLRVQGIIDKKIVYMFEISGKYEILRKIPSECFFLIKYFNVLQHKELDVY